MALESGDTLGVTFQHPIYTRSGWTAAGLLEAGDEVLTYSGYVPVADVSRHVGLYPVYNLEVKDLHNFLVGDVGVVVHNTGLCKFLKSKYSDYSKWLKTHPDSWLNDSKVNNFVQKMLNNDPYIFSQPIYSTTKNGKTYLIDGHHRLKAAKRINKQHGIDIELPHSNIAPENINTISPYKDIDDLIKNSYLPND